MLRFSFSRETRAHALTIVLLLAATAMTVATLWLLFARGREFMDHELRQRLISTAAVAASQIDGKVVASVINKEDMAKPEFTELVRRLQLVLNSAPNINSVYIMRKTKDPNVLEFVADAASLDTFEVMDTNKDGVIQPDEEVPFPGEAYDVSNVPALRNEAFLYPAVDSQMTTDQWGTVISGYAPVVRTDTGEVVGTLGIDMSADEYLRLSSGIFSSFLFLLLLLGATSIAGGVGLLFLERRMELYQKLERERMGLLLLASHQLGEPLTIFKYSAETLGDEINSPELRKAVEDHIRAVQEGVFRMNSILNVMKQAAKIEEHGVEYRPSWTYLDAIIQSVRTECEPYLRRKQQTLELSFDGDMRVWADAKLLGSVLLELFDNAMAYTTTGSTITVSAHRIGDRVRVKVKDNGCGIPAADLPRMFDKFVRASNASKHKPDGNGLGLFIARGIIRSAGGDIWIESKEGKCTTVTFEIPAVPSGRGSNKEARDLRIL